jgi:hypothetical protein
VARVDANNSPLIELVDSYLPNGSRKQSMQIFPILLSWSESLPLRSAKTPTIDLANSTDSASSPLRSIKLLNGFGAVLCGGEFALAKSVPHSTFTAHAQRIPGYLEYTAHTDTIPESNGLSRALEEQCTPRVSQHTIGLLVTPRG